MAVFFGQTYLTPESSNPIQPVLVGTGSELSCLEVHRVGTWSEERYGGRRAVALRAEGFSAEVARETAKRLDPHKLLLLQSEVDAFARGADGPWRRFVDHRDCSFFTRWTMERRTEIRRKLLARLEALVAAPKPAETPAQAESEWDNPREQYQAYARTEAELRERLARFVTQVRSGASESLRAAYGGDDTRLVREVVVEALLPERNTPNVLFAKGILGALDPYSTYFPADEFEEFYSDLSGGVTGVGVRLRRVPRGYLVESVVPESPAARSGRIRAGDVITAVDGTALGGLEDAAAKRLFRGKPGSEARLTVEGKGVVSLRRDHFDFEESKVASRIIFPGKGRGAVGVIEVPSFYGRGGMGEGSERSSAEDFERALKGILQSGTSVSGLVVDLRGNPGGYLEEAVSMAGMLIGNEPVVAVVGRDSQRVLRDEQAKPLYEGPLVVLVDEESASASEVLAGALKDHQRALLVGTPRTFGKGTVQKLFDLGDELFGARWSGLPATGVVKLTTSVFYSPLGHSPANGGVQTHIPLGSPAKAPPTAVSMQVADLDPFVDPPALERIHAKAERLNEHAAHIARSLRTEREGPAKGLQERLDEAVAIAAALAEREARTASTEGLTKSR